MKKELWLDKYGYLRDQKVMSSDAFLGYIEVEVPKKTVTKEIPVEGVHNMDGYKTLVEVQPLPINIKNPRLVFDVEE